MPSAALILTMTAYQRSRIEAGYPFSRSKVFRIGEFKKIDVVDPYRKGRLTFEMALSQIDDSLGRWIEKMNRIIR